MSLHAVELKVIGTFSCYIDAESPEAAQDEIKRRAALLQPDSVIFDAHAYQMQHCDICGEDHFGPVCREHAIRPSWERERL
jgi:hypothetical protein